MKDEPKFNPDELPIVYDPDTFQAYRVLDGWRLAFIREVLGSNVHLTNDEEELLRYCLNSEKILEHKRTTLNKIRKRYIEWELPI